MESLVRVDPREIPEWKVLKAIEVLLERREPQVSQVIPAKTAPMGRRAKMELMVHEEIVVRLETLAQWAILGHPVHLDHVDPLEWAVVRVSWAYLESRERVDSLVNQG